MKRSEVWWVDFEPSIGGEINKQRPAVIVSNNDANRVLNRLQVVPLTNKVARLYPGEAYVILNGNQSKAMANQLATVSKSRLKTKIGELSDQDLALVEQAIKVQLGLK